MFDLVRRKPGRELGRFDSDVQRLFREFLDWNWPPRRFFDFDDLEPLFDGPQVNVSEDAGHVYVEALVPGLKQENLDLGLAGDQLTIRGEIRSESENKDRNYRVKELRAGSFQRVVQLPVEVLPDKASAELKDGVLRVTLPKSPESREKVRHIKVKAA